MKEQGSGSSLVHVSKVKWATNFCSRICSQRGNVQETNINQLFRGLFKNLMKEMRMYAQKFIDKARVHILIEKKPTKWLYLWPLGVTRFWIDQCWIFLYLHLNYGVWKKRDSGCTTFKAFNLWEGYFYFLVIWKAFCFVFIYTLSWIRVYIVHLTKKLHETWLLYSL